MKRILLGLLLLLMVTGCKERYEPPIKSVASGYLVVEGVINSGPGNTTIMLSRSTPLDSTGRVYEQGAGVTLLGEDNSHVSLFEQTAGHYSADNLNLNKAIKYRIKIQTVSGKEYLSDFAPVLTNPPIDSISWLRENGDVQMYINTHNPLNNTRYYQWEYDETWEFHSQYYSFLKYKIEQIQGVQIYSVVYKDSLHFTYDSSIYTCWQFNHSGNILLGSTAKLSQDNIYLPIALIPKDSWKLSELYSIKVKQYAWTKEGYNFLEIMKKNTEIVGSVFDAQPSQMIGNIRCATDPAEKVIGYFNISPVREKRIFISKSEVPGWNYKSGCYSRTNANNSDSIKAFAIGLMPTEVVIPGFGGGIAIFAAAPPYCVDCTLSGTNVKPVFWP
jgi:Domain of unknown function (DUF4249)